MQSNKILNENLYDIFFLNQTFNSAKLIESAQADVSWLLTKINLEKKSTLLDVGCGTGRFLKAFLRYDLLCTGVDLSSSCIDLAKLNCPTLVDSLYNEDFLGYQMKYSKKYDLVFSAGVTFGYSLDNIDNQKYFKALAQSCNVGGYLVLDYLNLNWVNTFEKAARFWRETEDFYILDERKANNNYLSSQKVYINKLSGEIKTYKDIVKGFLINDLEKYFNFEGEYKLKLVKKYSSLGSDDDYDEFKSITPFLILIREK